MVRGRAGAGAHGTPQAHDRRRPRPRRGGYRVAREGGDGARGRSGGVTDGKALAGRSAIITGGTRGIGLALARLLAEGGASLVVSGRDAARLDAADEDIGTSGGAAV